MHLAAQHQCTRHRHIGQRKNEGAENGKKYGKRHGTEHLALNAYESHEWNIDDHDHDFAKGSTLADAGSREMHLLVHLLASEPQRRIPAGAAVDMGHHCLNNDNRRIHYHAKVDGAKTHQVAGNAEGLHHAEGKKHAQGDDTGHDKSRTPIAQKEDEHKDHDESALDKVMGDGALHPVDKVGAVDEGFDDHSLGQRLLYLGYTFLDVSAHLLEVFALEHDGYACHHLALAIARNGTEACGMAIVNRGHVAHPDGRRADCFHGYGGYVGKRLHRAESSNIILCGMFLYVGTSRVGIVLLESREHVAHGDAVGVEAVVVYRHLILLHVSAPPRHLCHTGRSGELLAHDPVLNSAELGERVLVFVALLGTHRVVIDFAQSRCHRPHLGVRVLGQVLGSGLQHLVDLRPRPIDVGIIVEHERNDRQSAARYAASFL